jgi:hypothetical protein
MKFMITWKIRPGSYKPAVEEFLRAGAPAPRGLESIGRWHAPGSTLGWHLVQGNDATALAQHVAEWANLVDLEVTPVLEDADASAGLSRVYAKR